MGHLAPKRYRYGGAFIGADLDKHGLLGSGTLCYKYIQSAQSTGNTSTSVVTTS